MIIALADEDKSALAQLCVPPGQPGSGRVRYAAAMHFNRAGQLSDEALEVFRICSPYDGEDPAGLLRDRGLAAEIPSTGIPSSTAALRLLLDETDLYLAGLRGPGIAEARAGLAQWGGGAIRLPDDPPRNGVVERWLKPALDQLVLSHPALSHAIGLAAPYLHWITYDGYPPDDIGADFARGHAYSSLIGEGGALAAPDWDLGLFLIAPNVLYRDHRHRAPELYAPLTGPHGWRFGPDRPLVVRPAHQPVWNDPFAPHLTKVGPVPFLCLFCWTRDVNAVAEVIAASDWPALEALRLSGA